MIDIDFASYGDEDTLHVIGDDIHQVVSNLEDAAVSLFKCFSDNESKP